MIRFIRTIIVGLMILAAWAGLARTAQAAGVVGNGTPGSCTQAALTAALAGGGTVTFNCGGPKSILVTSQMTINQNTVIQGGGIITITGGLTTRLFYVSASLTLNNITLDSAYSAGNGDGGAILNVGTLSLNNVTIQYSQTPGCGGAIWSNGVNHISNSSFKNNTGVSGGGAICTGQFGTTVLQITNSSFSNNKVTDPNTGYGGAIHVNGPVAEVTIVDSGFINNQAHFGGAIYVWPGGTATIRTQNSDHKTFFLGNSVTENGGAIYNKGSLSISGVEFNGNAGPQNTLLAGYGGGVANLGVLTLSDSLFSVNRGRFGGGLFVGGSGTNARADIQRTIFSLNNSGSRGGGLYVSDNTTVVTVTNSVFSINTAVVGGGVARFNARLDISNSSFADNQATNAGGGLEIEAGPSTDPTFVSVTSATFSGNTVSNNQGGGIYNQGYSVLKNLTFKNNSNGIYNAGTTHLGNSVLDNPGSLNCDGTGAPISSDSHNLSADNSCALEQNGIAAQLGPRITNNNGINKTVFHLPLAGSPLINGAANCPTRDQRGATRPDTCDIGAVEYGGVGPQVYLPVIMRK